MSELYIPRRRTCHSEAEGPVTGELLGFPGPSETFCMPDPYRLGNNHLPALAKTEGSMSTLTKASIDTERRAGEAEQRGEARMGMLTERGGGIGGGKWQ